MIIKKILLTCFSLLIILTGCSVKKEEKSETTKQETTVTTPKKEAYDFTVFDNEGNKVQLSDFKGKKVYINVWASWCSYCAKEAPELEKYYNSIKNNEEIVFLSVTSPNDKVYENTKPADKSKETILNKAKELGITYPILYDNNDRFFINYEIGAFPTHIFINKDGTIEETVPGDLTKEQLESYVAKLK